MARRTPAGDPETLARLQGELLGLHEAYAEGQLEEAEYRARQAGLHEAIRKLQGPPPRKPVAWARLAKRAIILVAVLFTISVRAAPEAFAASLKPATEFLSTPLAGFITLGAILILALTLVPAVASRDWGLGLLIALAGSLVLSLLHATLIVLPQQVEVPPNLLERAMGTGPRYYYDYGPQVVDFITQVASLLPFGMLGMAPLAFLKKPHE
ncbi:MAG: hypothetical protein HY558_01510 [Euryarchaeota archaeon]|nr:hypothetical protein [Euryarchaeota archaeon]